MTREESLFRHMQDMLRSFNDLGREKRELQKAAARIVEIDSQRADLADEADKMLSRYNTLTGKTITLDDVRNSIREAGAL